MPEMAILYMSFSYTHINLTSTKQIRLHEVKQKQNMSQITKWIKSYI